VLAILLACINTMLMAMREQTSDIGILKALGFTDGSMFGLLIAQGMFLCMLGGGLGLLLAWATEEPVSEGLGSMFPGYHVQPGTYAFAAGITVLLGLLAGFVPALGAQKLRSVQALRGTD
jgi:putative ABC transport system permease protein